MEIVIEASQRLDPTKLLWEKGVVVVCQFYFALDFCQIAYSDALEVATNFGICSGLPVN